MRPISIALLAIALVLTPASFASADETDVHPDIAFALEHLPGGHATSATTAEWPALGITFEVGDSLARSVGTCGTGLTCVYSGSEMNGNKASFAGCSTWSTTAFGTVASIANARTSGWTNARNSSGTTIASVTYGTSANVPAGVTSIACAGDGAVR